MEQQRKSRDEGGRQVVTEKMDGRERTKMEGEVAATRSGDSGGGGGDGCDLGEMEMKRAHGVEAGLLPGWSGECWELQRMGCSEVSEREVESWERWGEKERKKFMGSHVCMGDGSGRVWVDHGWWLR
ncbi:hypothetical protein AMTR_s00076p00168260 [Amborella trichopoda]|uniref:Uncharacterized protein n=1 Tax=Amborella trichopoda TaxID=13333 RepID=W1P9W4_AMBTC|nr:hypothetical protein AMTR_s00076p00168260 [Amborella trichopoda]